MALTVTKTELANKALTLLGESTVLNNIEDADDAAAKTLNLHMDSAFRSALVTYEWSFATGVTETPMAIIRENPATGYAFAYQPPKDSLRVRRVGVKGSFMDLVDRRPEEEIPFRELIYKGATEIHTNLTDAHCEYTQNISIDSAYPPSFTRIAAAYLALDAGSGIVTNNFAKIQRRLDNNIKIWVNRAVAEDMVTRSAKIRPVSPFIAVRNDAEFSASSVYRR